MTLKTPKPRPDSNEAGQRSGAPNESEARATRARVVGVPRGPLVIPTFDTEQMGTEMRGFLGRYEADYDVLNSASRRLLLDGYQGIGRAANRWREANERSGRLKPDIIDMLGYVRAGIGKESIEHYLAHIEELEHLLAEMVSGISQQGIAYTMNEFGIPHDQFIGRLQALFALMEKGSEGLGDPPKELIQYYDELAQFIEHYTFFRNWSGDRGRLRETPEDWDMDLKTLLDQKGVGDPSIIQKTQRIRGTFPKKSHISTRDIEEAAHFHVEQLMRIIVDRKLEQLLKLSGDRRPSMEQLGQELLAFVHYTLKNRKRVLNRSYSELFAPQADGRKLVEHYHPPIVGAGELLRALHRTLRFIYSEAQQKEYLITHP